MASFSSPDFLVDATKNFQSEKDFDILIQKIKILQKKFEEGKIKEKISNLKIGDKLFLTLDEINIDDLNHIGKEEINIYIDLHAYGRYIDEVIYQGIYDPEDGDNFENYWKVDDPFYVKAYNYLDFSHLEKSFSNEYFKTTPNADWKNNEYYKDPGNDAVYPITVYAYFHLIQKSEENKYIYGINLDAVLKKPKWFQIKTTIEVDDGKPLRGYHFCKVKKDGTVEEENDDNISFFEGWKYKIDYDGYLILKISENNPYERSKRPENKEPNAKIARTE